MKVCVTGATGFLGAQLAAALVERGDDVRVTVRDRNRIKALQGVEVETVGANVLDRASMRKALKGTDILFHAAGMVASRPRREVWRANAVAPRVAVETAAEQGIGRVVLTSSVSAIGPAPDARPANESTAYPQAGTGMIYPDAKHEGELAALAAGSRLGVEVVVVNPGYILGVPVNRRLPGQTSTRIIGNYLRGRLPAIVDSFTNIVDVEDVAAGHLLACDKGKPGERYILGGDNMRWSDVIERTARISGVHNPAIVLPAETEKAAALGQKLRAPIPMLEGVRLMAPDWRYSSAKAKRELGYAPRSATDALTRTVEWYLELIEDDRFANSSRNSFDWISGGLRLAGRLHLLDALEVLGSLAGRRVVIT